jgi:hypothetical protein
MAPAGSRPVTRREVTLRRRARGRSALAGLAAFPANHVTQAVELEAAAVLQALLQLGADSRLDGGAEWRSHGWTGCEACNCERVDR